MVAFSYTTALAFAQISVIEGRRLTTDSETTNPPCTPRDYSITVLPNVHHNPDSPWKRNAEGEYHFDLPEATAGWFRAAIYEAPCPSFARHPEGKATFNCESTGEWRMTKETCSHSSSDCLARTVEVTTADFYSNGFPMASGDDGARVTRPCVGLGPWTGGELEFICHERDWKLNGDITCTQTTVVEEEIIDCKEQGGYQVTLSGEPADYTLPRGDFGERVSLPCAFATLTRGSIEFLCQDNGDWAAVGQQCSAPRTATRVQESACSARAKNLAINGIRQRFIVQAGAIGDSVEVECSGELEGTATFQCRERSGRARWRLQRHSCQ